jgi:hypothetical protein
VKKIIKKWTFSTFITDYQKSRLTTFSDISNFVNGFEICIKFWVFGTPRDFFSKIISLALLAFF